MLQPGFAMVFFHMLGSEYIVYSVLDRQMSVTITDCCDIVLFYGVITSHKRFATLPSDYSAKILVTRSGENRVAESVMWFEINPP